jgi:AcrR family transcriptional regulator
MVEEGYSAATSRRVAERAGLRSQLVHYYYGSMDDLFVAVYERSEQEFLRKHLQAVSAPNPLRALWTLFVHPSRTRLAEEFIALSARRKSMRKITARVLEQIHSINAIFIARYLEEAGLDAHAYPPLVISHMLNGLSRALVSGESLGATTGRTEVLAFAERWLSLLEAAHGARRASNQQMQAAEAL